jgi:hypothetical protein
VPADLHLTQAQDLFSPTRPIESGKVGASSEPQILF